MKITKNHRDHYPVRYANRESTGGGACCCCISISIGNNTSGKGKKRKNGKQGKGWIIDSAFISKNG